MSESEPTTCDLCGDTYALHDGMEPTGYCDPCAQARVEELEKLLDEHEKKAAQLEQDIAKLQEGHRVVVAEARKVAEAARAAKPQVILVDGLQVVELSRAEREPPKVSIEQVRQPLTAILGRLDLVKVAGDHDEDLGAIRAAALQLKKLCDDAEREAREHPLLNVVAETWAHDAKACPVCSVAWSVETMRARGARVGSVAPHVLVCAACWDEFRARFRKPFWLSWYQTEASGPFTLHSPWWVSGERGSGDARSIVAAVRAPDADAAKALVVAAHDKPGDLEWRFCEERPSGWSPFSERFPRAAWMKWEG